MGRDGGWSREIMRSLEGGTYTFGKEAPWATWGFGLWRQIGCPCFGALVTDRRLSVLKSFHATLCGGFY